PLSSAFAGEFLILAGVLRRGWGWAGVGAVAIVLAAMYMLRLISAVLHREVGPAVSDAALDLRPAELGFLVPLVACLLALSAWPAAISHRAFNTTLPRNAFNFTLTNGPRGISASGSVSQADFQQALRILKSLPPSARPVVVEPRGDGSYVMTVDGQTTTVRLP